MAQLALSGRLGSHVPESLLHHGLARDLTPVSCGDNALERGIGSRAGAEAFCTKSHR